MKSKINWKHIVLFVVICAGLLYITGSWLMSLGIMLLLFVAYYMIDEIEVWWKKKHEE